MADLDYRSFLPQEEVPVTPEVMPQGSGRAFDPGAPQPVPEQPAAALPARVEPPGPRQAGEPSPFAGQPRIGVSPTTGKEDTGPGLSDAEDARNWQKWRQEVERTYSENLREHGGTHELITPSTPFKITDHENFPELVELRKAQQAFTPKEQREYGGRIEALDRRIRHETDAKNKQAQVADDARRKAEGVHAEPALEGVEQAAKTAGAVSQSLDTMEKKYALNSQHNDPKIAAQNDFTLRVSPLRTLAQRNPDGTYDTRLLRDIVANTARLNGLPADTAASYVMYIGSPIWTDPDNGNRLARGVNGTTGIGATNYIVTGRDGKGHYTLTMGDGKELLLDRYAFQMLDRGRVSGYATAKKIDAETQQRRQEGSFGDRATRFVKRQFMPSPDAP